MIELIVAATSMLTRKKIVAFFFTSLLALCSRVHAQTCERANECPTNSICAPSIVSWLCLGSRCQFTGRTDSLACRNATGPCDRLETCSNGACPRDTKQPASTPCTCGSGAALRGGACDGVNNVCICATVITQAPTPSPNQDLTSSTTTTLRTSTALPTSQSRSSVISVTPPSTATSQRDSFPESSTFQRSSALGVPIQTAATGAAPPTTPAAAPRNDLVFLVIPAVLLLIIGAAVAVFYVRKSRKLARQAADNPAFESAREMEPGDSYGSLSLSPSSDGGPNPVYGPIGGPIVGAYAPMPASQSTYTRPPSQS